jgi:hypothetical protein
VLSWQAVGLTEGLPATAANRFHKELRFFFSLLKRKKEAKKEKNSPTLVLYGNAPPEDYTPTKLPRRGKQAAAAAVTLPFSQLKLGRRVSGDPPPAATGEYCSRNSIQKNNTAQSLTNSFVRCFLK